MEQQTEHQQTNQNNKGSFALAIQQVWSLSTFSTHKLSATQASGAMNFYPFAALLLGLLLGAIVWLFFGFQAEITAALLLLVWAKFGGAQSMESLARTVDAISSNRDEQTWQAFKQGDKLPLGSMGITVLVLMLILQWVLLVNIIYSEWWAVIVLMPLVGWSFGQMVMLGSPWSQPHPHFASNWRHEAGIGWLWPQWLLVLMALALTSGWTLAFLAVSTWAYIVWWRRKAGGINFDVALAWVELSKLAWLLGLALFLLPESALTIG